jgi:hypothetical protein
VDNKFKASEAVLVLAQTWMYMALGALALYFILKAIEERPHLRAKVYVGYHVPVEHVPDEAAQWEKEHPVPEGKET